MKTVRPIHSLLFAAFPVLFLYARNADEVPNGQLVVPLLVSVAGAATVLYALRLAVKDWQRAALIASVVILSFFSYGHVWEAVKNREVSGFIVDRDIFLLLPWGLFTAGILLIAFGARRFVNETATILNVVALFLVATSAYSIVRSGGAPRERAADCPPRLDAVPAASVKPARDIYYLIFDRYGGSETLTRDYAFDNSEMLGFLTGRGFYVADDSRANYPRTAHSLTSSLNASYLDCLATPGSAKESSWGRIFAALEDHQVGRFLKKSGYRYVHIGSWWDGTGKSPIADVNYSYEGRIGFASLLYSTTIARPFGEYLGLSDPQRIKDYKRVLFQLDTLHAMARAPGPKFVFAHLLLPHEPFVFDRDGTYQTEVQSQRRGRRDSYLEQLRFTNREIQRLIDELLARPPETRPIIVLQSDEGPHPPRYDVEGAAFDWTSAAPEEINQTLRILNAYYLPGTPDPGLYRRITPVNTFRIIFDAYLGTHLGRLTDEVFVYADDDHPYRFSRVTDRVWEPLPALDRGD